MPADTNDRETDDADRADLAALAAMDLKFELHWTEADIAAALRRPVEWVSTAIERALAEDAKHSVMN